MSTILGNPITLGVGSKVLDYTEKAKQVKAENEARIASPEEALNIVGVQTEEEVTTDETN